jgi:hypothetical protein
VLDAFAPVPAVLVLLRGLAAVVGAEGRPAVLDTFARGPTVLVLLRGHATVVGAYGIPAVLDAFARGPTVLVLLRCLATVVGAGGIPAVLATFIPDPAVHVLLRGLAAVSGAERLVRQAGAVTGSFLHRHLSFDFAYMSVVHWEDRNYCNREPDGEQYGNLGNNMGLSQYIDFQFTVAIGACWWNSFHFFFEQ